MCRIRKLKEALKAITISRFHCGKSKNENVIPAEAGIQVEKLDSRLRACCQSPFSFRYCPKSKMVSSIKVKTENDALEIPKYSVQQ